MALITFVDEDDNVVGAGTKEEALEKGVIHRIVRIFLFNTKGEVLVQKRAEHLTSSPGKWDQSVGGHVDEGETYMEAARREAREELGLDNLDPDEVTRVFRIEGRRKRFNMIYRAFSDATVTANPEEVSEVRWIAPEELTRWMTDRPGDFTQGCIDSFTLLNCRNQ